MHCVWDEISLALIGNPAGDFELFWNTVVQGTGYVCSFQIHIKYLQYLQIKVQYAAYIICLTVTGSNTMYSFISTI